MEDMSSLKARIAEVHADIAKADETMTKFNITPASIDAFLQSIPYQLILASPRNPTPGPPTIDAVLARVRFILQVLAKGLHNRTKPALTVLSVCQHNLTCLFYEIERVVGMSNLRRFLREQMLLHPLRRMPVAQYLFMLADARVDVGIHECFKEVTRKFGAWQDSVRDTFCILADPELLPAEIFDSGLVRIPQPEAGMEESCSICDLRYEYAVVVTARSAMRTPCNHHCCHACLHRWRLECAHTGTYTCPLCRSCLVCGAPGCTFHVVPGELSPPYSLQAFLEADFEGDATRSAPLYGFQPEHLRRLRENTRAQRVRFAYAYMKSLDAAASAKERRIFEMRRDDAMKAVKVLIQSEVRRSQGADSICNQIRVLSL